MKAKVRVKSLSAEGGEYTCQFICCDSVSVCNKEYKLACDDAKDPPIIIFNDSKKYNVKKKLFDFISAHSKETMIIEIGGNAVTGVELIYG